LKTNSLLIKILVEILMSLTKVEIEMEGWIWVSIWTWSSTPFMRYRKHFLFLSSWKMKAKSRFFWLSSSVAALFLVANTMW
jgi:hypothetical protein